MQGRSELRGFTIIEIMIAILILSFIGIKASQFLKKNQAVLQSTEKQNALMNLSQSVVGRFKSEIEQSVSLFPSCEDNAASGLISGDCSALEVRAGITPLPGLYREDVDNLDDFLPTNDLTSNPSTLINDSDAVRLVLYNFTGSFNCKLNPRHTASANPSQTSGVGVGAQRLWAHPQCADVLEVGKLYILTEEINDVIYSNIFQVTALSTLVLGDSTTEIQVDHTSSQSPYNQPGGLGLAGFTSEARIYPVKLVEWAVDGAEGGLYRREFNPDSNDLTGEGEWEVIDPAVEDMQLAYTTQTLTGGSLHLRTVTWTADDDNNGLEDLVGINPHLVFRSSVEDSTKAGTYDNPLSEAVEADSFPRQESHFLAVVRNR